MIRLPTWGQTYEAAKARLPALKTDHPTLDECYVLWLLCDLSRRLTVSLRQEKLWGAWTDLESAIDTVKILDGFELLLDAASQQIRAIHPQRPLFIKDPPDVDARRNARWRFRKLDLAMAELRQHYGFPATISGMARASRPGRPSPNWIVDLYARALANHFKAATHSPQWSLICRLLKTTPPIPTVSYEKEHLRQRLNLDSRRARRPAQLGPNLDDLAASLPASWEAEKASFLK